MMGGDDDDADDEGDPDDDCAKKLYTAECQQFLNGAGNTVLFTFCQVLISMVQNYS